MYNSSMQFSDFGNKITNESGILQLMDDLGTALAGDPPIAMFGGGNPAQIPDVTKAFTESLTNILKDTSKTTAMLGNYDTPQGNAEFITDIKNFMNRHYNLGINEANIAITSGSQSGYFMLFNILAGKTNGKNKKILFPIVPEYIGYADQGLEPEMFAANLPKIENIGDHEFKYHINFETLNVDEDIAAISLSRPTNPSGNVISNEELEKLATIARTQNIPLIIDNAYGQPFPGVINNSAKLMWGDNIVLSLSLSKVGLPTSRVGIFIGPPKLMAALSSANAILNLASPSIGQYIVSPLLKNDKLLDLSKNNIQPFYADRREKMMGLINKNFPKSLPWRLHSYEGSYFLWLWCDGAKKTSMQMYNWLKQRQVLVVPGEYFFHDVDPNKWPHAGQCLRINFARPDAEIEQGIPILAQAIKQAYKK